MSPRKVTGGGVSPLSGGAPRNASQGSIKGCLHIEWQSLTWGEIVDLEYGKSLRDYKNQNFGYRVFGSNGPIGWCEKKLADGPGVILGRKGAYRGVQFSHNAFYVIDTAYYLKPKIDLDMRWLYYAVIFHNLGEIDDGSPIPSTTRSAVYVRSVEVPPLPIQKAIAHILGALDDRIELCRRMNETLESMARALFKDWFIDFGTVHAKMEGRVPPGLSPEIAALFPSKLVESELGEIPEGWECGSILKLARLLSGGTPKTSELEYWDGEIPWASAKDVSQCGQGFLIQTERTITKRGLEESSTKMIPALSTVVVARGATTGRLTMFGIDMAMNQTCYGLYSRIGTPFSLYCHSKHFMESMVLSAHGSVFDTITTGTFEATPVLLPSVSSLKAFEQQVTPHFEQILTNLRKVASLSTLRDTLLPKLLSGELSVPEAMLQVEAA